MPETLEQWKSQLSQLPETDREELAHFLLQSLEPFEAEDDEAAWVAELNRRREEIKSGRVVGEPYEKVMAELRAKHS